MPEPTENINPVSFPELEAVFPSGEPYMRIKQYLMVQVTPTVVVPGKDFRPCRIRLSILPIDELRGFVFVKQLRKLRAPHRDL